MILHLSYVYYYLIVSYSLKNKVKNYLNIPSFNNSLKYILKIKLWPLIFKLSLISIFKWCKTNHNIFIKIKLKEFKWSRNDFSNNRVMF